MKTSSGFSLSKYIENRMKASSRLQPGEKINKISNLKQAPGFSLVSE